MVGITNGRLACFRSFCDCNTLFCAGQWAYVVDAFSVVLRFVFFFFLWVCRGKRWWSLSLSLCVCEYVWTEWSLLCCVVSCLFRLGFSSTPNRPCGARCCRCRSLRLYFLIGRLDCSVPSCFFFPCQGPPPPSINQSIKNQKRAREPTSTKDDLMARQSRSNLDTMTLICLCSSRQLVISSVVRTLKRTRIRNFVC